MARGGSRFHARDGLILSGQARADALTSVFKPQIAGSAPVTLGMNGSFRSETVMSAAASRVEAEGRVTIREETDVGLDPQGVAIGVDEEVADSFWVLPGDEDSEEAGEDAQGCDDG